MAPFWVHSSTVKINTKEPISIFLKSEFKLLAKADIIVLCGCRAYIVIIIKGNDNQIKRLMEIIFAHEKSAVILINIWNLCSIIISFIQPNRITVSPRA